MGEGAKIIEGAPLEQFERVAVYGGDGTRVVRAFLTDEISDFFAYGSDCSIPFNDVPRASRKFRISHRRTGRVLPHLKALTLRQALGLIAELDSSFQGWGQIEHRGEERAVVGFQGEPSQIMRTLYTSWLERGLVSVSRMSSPLKAGIPPRPVSLARSS